MAEPLDQPLGVVAREELADDLARFGETLEAMERVGAPHLIRARGGNRAGVLRIPMRRTETPGRKQVMPAHQTQHAVLADGQASMRRTGPDLTIAFAVERGRC